MNSARTIANRELFAIVRDTLLEGKTVRVAVNGQSMLPFFRSGSTITLHPVREGDIRKYNVVMADAGHAFVVHRIVEVGDDIITLLGDGNLRGTESVTRDIWRGGVLGNAPLLRKAVGLASPSPSLSTRNFPQNIIATY